MRLGLAGRNALVTAASSGLGLAAARALAAEGANVAICARDPERLKEARWRIEDCGSGTVRASTVDVTDPDAVASWVADCQGWFGEPHVLVSNTGGVPAGPADAFSVADYRDALETSMLPHIGLVLACAKSMAQAGWGRIVLITSEAVRQPIPDIALSGVARVGVLAFARSMVHALGANGITINVLAPGYHRTPALDSLLGDQPEAALQRMVSDVPLGAIGQPADFGALVAFLASEQARFVTGTVLPVDGGRTRGLP
jgi:3-oxoacyl-[acyl-carrier protein] reductase